MKYLYETYQHTPIGSRIPTKIKENVNKIVFFLSFQKFFETYQDSAYNSYNPKIEARNLHKIEKNVRKRFFNVVFESLSKNYLVGNLQNSRKKMLILGNGNRC